jgi:hypothetical protein
MPRGRGRPSNAEKDALAQEASRSAAIWSTFCSPSQPASSTPASVVGPGNTPDTHDYAYGTNSEGLTSASRIAPCTPASLAPTPEASPCGLPAVHVLYVLVLSQATLQILVELRQMARVVCVRRRCPHRCPSRILSRRSPSLRCASVLVRHGVQVLALALLRLLRSHPLSVLLTIVN